MTDLLTSGGMLLQRQAPAAPAKVATPQKVDLEEEYARAWQEKWDTAKGRFTLKVRTMYLVSGDILRLHQGVELEVLKKTGKTDRRALVLGYWSFLAAERTKLLADLKADPLGLQIWNEAVAQESPSFSRPEDAAFKEEVETQLVAKHVQTKEKELKKSGLLGGGERLAKLLLPVNEIITDQRQDYENGVLRAVSRWKIPPISTSDLPRLTTEAGLWLTAIGGLVLTAASGGALAPLVIGGLLVAGGTAAQVEGGRMGGAEAAAAEAMEDQLEGKAKDAALNTLDALVARIEGQQDVVAAACVEAALAKKLSITKTNPEKLKKFVWSQLFPTIPFAGRQAIIQERMMKGMSDEVHKALNKK